MPYKPLKTIILPNKPKNYYETIFSVTITV